MAQSNQLPILLLHEMAQRGRQKAHNLPQQIEVKTTWDGVGFKSGNTLMVAPLEQIKEILTRVTISRIPGAKEWVKDGRLGELNIVNMTMWINNPNESSPHFHMRALHPHSFDVMRYFCGEVTKVQAFFKKGKDRQIWSNVQVNLLYENGTLIQIDLLIYIY